MEVDDGKLKRRYKDGYTTARSIIAQGTALKGLGIALGIAIVALASTVANNAPQMLFGAVVIGFVVAAMFHMWGVMITAQGQMVLALFDTAVNSSPFISEETKLAIMYQLQPAAAEPVADASDPGI